ncbi:MAG: SWIM zinc finger family protein [Clostridia bacterium]|nr:SWIM zinc finger family protein [Clostridia bacterium]
MKKKIQINDIFFMLVILFGLILHIVCIFSFASPDETYYFAVPLRLINGDSLIQNEWHLTQFASLFQYFPVLLWLKIKGSTEGMILFIRALYLTIHTGTAFGIYKFFKKYGTAAVCAAAVFYLQTPYTFMTVGYTSVYALGLLLSAMLLFAIYNDPKKIYYICVGFCFGCCCVCNPFFVFAYPLYLIFCIFWRNVLTKKDKKSESAHQNQEGYNIFFDSNAVLLFSSGVGIIAVISIIFYFATGGTLSSLPENIGMMLNSTEYFGSYSDKISGIYAEYSKMYFNMPFLCPLLFAFLIFDKNRRKPIHRLIYLICTFIITGVFSVNNLVHIFIKNDTDIGVFSALLPMTVFSFVCIILLKNRNRPMLFCVYIPGVVGTFFQAVSSRTFFAAVGWACVVCAVSGMFFVRDLIIEIREDLNKDSKTAEKSKQTLFRVSKAVICLSFCSCLIFQIAGYLCVHAYIQYLPYVQENYTFDSKNRPQSYRLTNGPLAGCYASEADYEEYMNTLKDLDFIKSESDEDAPVLILSEKTWMYLYVERPFATYTAWHQFIRFDALKQYYEANPDKKPKYIYISESREMRKKEAAVRHIFECKRKTLSNGILLTVKD